MKKPEKINRVIYLLFFIILLSFILYASDVSAGSSNLPSLIKVGEIYKIQPSDTNELIVKILEIDNKNGWVKVNETRFGGETLWINIGQIITIRSK
jgi:hypothetical protein